MREVGGAAAVVGCLWGVCRVRAVYFLLPELLAAATRTVRRSGGFYVLFSESFARQESLDFRRQSACSVT